jgi:uncharacterized protein (DUF1330 family)
MNWLSYLGIGFSIIAAIVNVTVLIAIKFNDLHHVQKDLDEIKEDLKCFGDKFIKLDERVSQLEGKLS